MVKKKLWFWQNMLTPHMSELSVKLLMFNHDVTFVSNQVLSKERKALGWQTLKTGNVKLKLARTKNIVVRLAKKAPIDSIHFCQGLRGNGLIRTAQKILRRRKIKFWVLMETINDSGLLGFVKKIYYRFLFYSWKNYLFGVLAIGSNMPDWVIDRGMTKKNVFPFAYFLNQKKNNFSRISKNCFRFIFVGALRKPKNVDKLLKALAILNLPKFELWIVGDGEEKNNLQNLAKELSFNQIRWFGVKPMTMVSNLIKQSDCLVLPSNHDGWGAVISEALMVGTPVICSDSCGASSVVNASREGIVFSKNSQKSFVRALKKQYLAGQWSTSRRKRLAAWARCLGALNGAKYLTEILNYLEKKNNRPLPPWETSIKKK